MDAKAREKFFDQVQNDLKNLSLETKRLKSLQNVREATEEAIVKVRTTAAASAASASVAQSQLYLLSNQVLYPLIQGCESKDGKVVRLSLSLIQRLIISRALDSKGTRSAADTLWMLMEAGIEEVKLLQTVTLLLTTSTVARHETLAKCLVICFRLNFTKDPTTNSIAGATVRQLVPAVFERVSSHTGQSSEDDPVSHSGSPEEMSPSFARLVAQMLPKDTDPLVADAFLLLQDLVLLVGAEQPRWMVGIVEMTRSFGLELLESILRKFSQLFATHEPFKILLKERVCSLVIKLFSPNVKYRPHHDPDGGSGAAGTQDRPYYPITSKLLRVVSILILEYHGLLTTETEIFLSLVHKFLDPDKPHWQHCMALEVIHKIAVCPDLLVFLCSTYDSCDSSKVFQDMANGLGAYVQNVLMAPMASGSGGGDQASDTSNSASGPNGGQGGGTYGGGAGLSHSGGPQPGFCFRNVWKPLTISFIGGQTKEVFLDLGDRSGEALPAVSDGYGISLAYACILDLVRSMSLVINPAISKDDEEAAASHRLLVEGAAWGLLPALSLLLDASTDDGSTENILKAFETYASLCGQLGVTKPRDAFLASLCKASLPPHYTLHVLKATPCTQTVSGPRVSGPHESAPAAFETAVTGEVMDIRHQVVAVGTPLPTSSLPASAHQGPVMLTAKNLQCMRSILSVAHCHGNILGNSWHIILTTLQHLVWILGLKPAAGGGLATLAGGSGGGGGASSAGSSESSSVITTAVMADLPVLSNMVTRLFESSRSLSDTSVSHLVDALCKLSDESMELASANREPSLFAVAKLLETAVVNLDRVDSVWRPVTSHLLLVCQHPHLRMRQWGTEALTFLTKQAMQHRFTPPLAENQRVQLQVLSPLAELCSIPFPDVRQKQLDTVLQVLHSSGESLSQQGWPLVLTIIGSLERAHSDILIRSAFQCLQLIFTDFLPAIPYRCYPQCVDAATKFGSQVTELNVSLTAVGLLWNLSDYFYQNFKTLQQHQEPEKVAEHQIFPDFPGCKNIPSFDKLWMCLYYKLKDLCLDPRPAVRKSSGQTLFSTIAAHGSVLDANTWQAVLWQVLFPLLDNVIIQSDNASPEKVPQSPEIMIHHSRNTAQKQWAETKVLTISGVVRVFNTKRKLLKTMSDYSKAWLLLLEYVEKMALSDTGEVSLAALKAMQEMIVTAGEEASPAPSTPDKNLTSVNWSICWKAWLNIGNQKAKFISNSSGDVTSAQQANMLLTGYVQIFTSLFPQIKGQFRREDADKLGEVLLACIQVQLDYDTEGRNALTQVHSAALQALAIVEEEALKTNRILTPAVFEILFKFVGRAFSTGNGNVSSTSGGKQGNVDANGSGTSSGNMERFREKLSVFGETCAERLAAFFLSAQSQPDLAWSHILFRSVEVLKPPLRLKYRCFRNSDWRTCIDVLLRILRVGLPVARRSAERGDGTAFEPFWRELASALEAFLFPEASVTEQQKQEERMTDEALDCKVIDLLRREVLPYPEFVPAFFIRKIVILLNRGSIHSTIKLNEDCSGSVGHREDFAKQCFETLLDFSMLRESGSGGDDAESVTSSDDGSVTSAAGSTSTLTNRLAITSLLQRFKEVLVDAIEGEKLNRNIPLQRQKTSELAFCLRAIATVVSSMKRSAAAAAATASSTSAPPQPVVDSSTWRQVIDLFPYLVQCADTNSALVGTSVKEALLQYQDLLAEPR